MKKIAFYSLLLLSVHVFAQPVKQDTNLSVAAIKLALQGVWGGPDDSYYFLFRGDSVKEWEADGADSSVKPFCSYVLSKDACDTMSAHVLGATGFFITITCNSVDYDESRCYFIKSVNMADMMLGIKGQYEESGHLKKKRNRDGGN